MPISAFKEVRVNQFEMSDAAIEETMRRIFGDAAEPMIEKLRASNPDEAKPPGAKLH